MSQRDKSDDALTTVCHTEEAIRFNEMMLESFYERMNRLQLMLAKSKGPWHEAAIRSAIDSTEQNIRLFQKDLEGLHLKLSQELGVWVETFAPPKDNKDKEIQKHSKILKYRGRVH